MSWDGLLRVLELAAYALAIVWMVNFALLLVCHGLAETVRLTAGERARLMRWLTVSTDVHHELWPFAWPGLLVTVVWCVAAGGWWQAAVETVMLLVWWFFRNWPDDDRRRRRRRRLLASVKRAGGRLVIVPVTT